MTQAPSMYSELGEMRLRALIDDFVDRVYADTMIGFFFRDFDPERLKKHEFQFTARALGGSVPYTGQPIRTAHAKHPIMGGQFNRRLTILRETLVDHDVPAAIRDHLLAHTERLRPLVTAQPGSQCIQEVMSGPLVSGWQPEKGPTKAAETSAETSTEGDGDHA